MNTKRLLTLALVFIMAMASVMGCKSKTSAESMFDVLKQAQNIEAGTCEMKVVANVEGTAVEATITGKFDGENTSLSAKVSVSGMSFDLKDVVVVTKDTMFLNVKTIKSAFSTFLEAGGVDLDSYGLDKDWLSLSLDGLSTEKDTTTTDTFLTAFDSAYKDLIKESDGTYKLSITSVDDVKKFLTATKKMVDDNTASWSKLIVDMYSKQDMSAYVDTMMANIKTEVLAEAEAQGVDMTEEDLDSMFSESDLSAADSVTEDTVKEALATASEEMSTAIDSITDSEFPDGSELTVTSSAKDGTYSFSGDLNVPESDASSQTAISVSMSVTEDKDVKVDVPSADDAGSLEKVIAKLIVTQMSAFSSYDDSSLEDSLDYTDDATVE